MEPTGRYPEESEVEGYTRTVAWKQESWLAMGVKLTLVIMERVIDITLDFRRMLSVSDNVLEAYYSQDTMGCLAAAIVIKCPNLTRLSVEIGTDQIRGLYYENDDDKGHTTDAQ